MRHGFKCPQCGVLSVSVKDSRPFSEGAVIRRRRECSAGHRYTTYEKVGHPDFPDSRDAEIDKLVRQKTLLFEVLKDLLPTKP